MNRANAILTALVWIVLASINYKLGELVRAQQSIAEVNRLMLAMEMDEVTRVVDHKTGMGYERRN